MKRKRKPRRPRLVRMYRRYLLSENAADFVRQVAGHYQTGTLLSLAWRGRRIVRRAAVMALGMLGDMRINHPLGRSLHDADRGVRLLTDQALRQIWLRDGNPAQQMKLARAAQLNRSFLFEESRDLLTALIEEAPALAEAYHQRAISVACLGEMELAIADCNQALEFNPYHFAAAAAMGQAMCEMGDRARGLECFERALRLNPDLEGVRARVRQLQRQLEQ